MAHFSTRLIRTFAIASFGFLFLLSVPATMYAAPMVTTDTPTFVDGSGATLNGIINPVGEPTVGWFQYSIENNFTNFSPKVYVVYIGSDTTSHTISHRINNLSPGTTYYYRVGAEQETSIPVYGGVQTFTTLSPNPGPPEGTPPPFVETLPESDVGSTFATLHGRVDPGGFQTIVWFQYALDSAFQTGSNAIYIEDIGAGTEPVEFSATADDLLPNTTYYYRAGALHTENDHTVSFYSESFTTLAEGQVPVSGGDQPSGQPTQPNIQGPIVEDTGAIVECVENCGYRELISLVQRIIDFLIFTIAMPLGAIIFMWAGFKYMTSGGDPGKLKEAKGMFFAVFVGLAIALAAWLVVNTLLNVLLNQEALQGGANLLEDVNR